MADVTGGHMHAALSRAAYQAPLFAPGRSVTVPDRKFHGISVRRELSSGGFTYSLYLTRLSKQT